MAAAEGAPPAAHVARRLHRRLLPLPTAAIARLVLAAFLLLATAATAPSPATAGRGSRASRAGTATAKAARRAAGAARALVRGTAVDGPRHTGRAIRRNPKLFVAGSLLIGAMGAIAHKFGFNGEHVGLALSAAAVAAQARAAWPTLKLARGRELARRIGADLLWPAALFGLSYGAGHAITSHVPMVETGGARELVTAFAASAVIGGDAPAVGVTALDTNRGGDSH